MLCCVILGVDLSPPFLEVFKALAEGGVPAQEFLPKPLAER